MRIRTCTNESQGTEQFKVKCTLENKGGPLWSFVADEKKSHLVLDVLTWAKLAKLYNPEGAAEDMASQDPLDDFAEVEMTTWSEGPSKYDPGAGGYSIQIVSLPNKEELREFVESIIIYSDTLEQGDADLLWESLDMLEADLNKMDGYTDDSNW